MKLILVITECRLGGAGSRSTAGIGFGGAFFGTSNRGLYTFMNLSLLL